MSRPQSPERDMRLGEVCPGWTPASWARRLRALADACEAMHPDLAERYRDWADRVMKKVKRDPIR